MNTEVAVSKLQYVPWGLLLSTGLGLLYAHDYCSWLEIHSFHFVHVSITTMVDTNIPIWRAILLFFLRGKTLNDSTIVGGLVILTASLIAQLVTKQDDTHAPRPQENAASQDQDLQAQEPQSRLMTLNPRTTSVKPTADQVRGTIITS